MFIAFGGVAAGLFFGLIFPGFHESYVAENGKVATAEVMGISSNTTINDEPYYYIRYKYTNDKGEEVTGRTNTAYTEDEANAIRRAGTMLIKFDEHGHSVAADYKKAAGSSFLWIFIIVFGAVGVGMGIAVIRQIVRFASEGRLKAVGREGRGFFIDSASRMSVNGVPMYYIKYSFVNEDRETVEVKTGSVYERHEVDIFRALGEFDIKYSEKRATITQKLSDIPDRVRYGLNYAGGQFYAQPPAGRSYTQNQNVPGYARATEGLNPVYDVLVKELEKEPSEADMHALLRQHQKSLDPETYTMLTAKIKEISARRWEEGFKESK